MKTERKFVLNNNYHIFRFIIFFKIIYSNEDLNKFYNFEKANLYIAPHMFEKCYFT